ncbi:DinB family protein [Ascidiimonas sp. W6]|uniref:DinB family protein n=1 Tax=Ascidiimonas meishanensis TaxID=3128903 RepID=UPI0030EF4A33
MLLDATRLNLNQLISLLNQLSDVEFSSRLEILNESSIGMHIRHIIEFYQCLDSATKTGQVNYDGRKRNLLLENDKALCVKAIQEIETSISSIKTDQSLVLCCDYSQEEDTASELIHINTSVLRELQYNLEHTVHHMAIIRIGVKTFETSVELDPDFGVAASTIRNKKVCVQ